MTRIPVFLGRIAWESGRFQKPWARGRPALFEHVREHLDRRSGRLTEPGMALPDEPERDGDAMRWGPGAADGVQTHHVRADENDARGAAAFNALKSLMKQPTAEGLKAFYDLASDDEVVAWVDPFLAARRDDPFIDDDRVRQFAFWLTKNAPDRGPVKLGLAMLGLWGHEKAPMLASVLGRHDEFTLFAAVTLFATTSDPEAQVFALAQAVDGWGRIQAVERLAETQDVAIKAWMVREGFRNTVLDEYLALLCAQSGELDVALQGETVDDALLAGARDILRALFQGGPGGDITDYERGADVAAQYLRLIAERPVGLKEFLLVMDLRGYADRDDLPRDEVRVVWSQAERAEVASLADAVLARPGWEAMAEEGLGSSDPEALWLASAAGKHLGLDVWSVHFERVRSDPTQGNWWELMQTDDVERVRRTIHLAQNSLPLDDIATGPADRQGFGDAYWGHAAVDMIVQDLGRFPGEGWSLIKAALRSPVVRNRHVALHALGEWPREAWPSEAHAALETARRDEPIAEVRERIAALRSGGPSFH